MYVYAILCYKELKCGLGSKLFLTFFHPTTGLINTHVNISATVFVRIVMFPLVIKAQQNAAKMHNNMPRMQMLQEKMTEARQTGNHMEGTRVCCFKNISIYARNLKLSSPLCKMASFLGFFLQ